MGGEPEDGVVEERTEMTEEDLATARGGEMESQPLVLLARQQGEESHPKEISKLLGQNSPSWAWLNPKPGASAHWRSKLARNESSNPEPSPNCNPARD